jgi:hypothetical protein
MEVKGLTAKQMVALAGRSLADGTLTSDFFVLLSGNTFEQAVQRANDGDSEQFVAVGSDPPVYVTAEEYALVQDPELKLIVEEYATEEAAFKSEFASSWVYMMTADRYAGPKTNVCTGRDDPTKAARNPGLSDEKTLQDMPSSSAFTAVSGLMGMGHAAGVLALVIAFVAVV